MYRVKEIFHSLQGEGAHSGTTALFVRFSGCNLWSGFESGRASALCKYCDTNFVNGDAYDLEALLSEVREHYEKHAPRLCVITGGEPTLQVDHELLEGLRDIGSWTVCMETNGTVEAKARPDWTSWSPKPFAPETKLGYLPDEVKVVYPQEGLNTLNQLLDFMQGLPGFHTFINRNTLFIQPNANIPSAEKRCLDAVMSYPNFRLSLQTHKILDLR